MFPLIEQNLSTYLDIGETSIPRCALVNTSTYLSGICYFSYFTAEKTENINNITSYSGSNSATATSLAKIAIYDVVYSGQIFGPNFPGWGFSNLPRDLRLISSCASDTNLWSIPNTAYPKSITRTWYKQRGNRYAVAVLWVGTGSSPTLIGQAQPNATTSNTILSKEPRIASAIAGNLPDLPDPALYSHFDSTTAILKIPYLEFTP